MKYCEIQVLETWYRDRPIYQTFFYISGKNNIFFIYNLNR
jgi:hypothetical protein